MKSKLTESTAPEREAEHPVDIGLRAWTDGVDTYIAYSAKDALGLYKEMNGCDHEDGFTLVSSHTSLTIIHNEDDDSWPEDGHTRTAAEWCEWNGRGMLCSTEW